MTLKFDLDPSGRKALTIAVLLFFEALLIPLQIHLQTTGQMPTPVQFVTWISIASLQLVTYLLLFLGYEKEKEET